MEVDLNIVGAMLSFDMALVHGYNVEVITDCSDTSVYIPVYGLFYINSLQVFFLEFSLIIELPGMCACCD